MHLKYNRFRSKWTRDGGAGLRFQIDRISLEHELFWFAVSLYLLVYQYEYQLIEINVSCLVPNFIPKCYHRLVQTYKNLHTLLVLYVHILVINYFSNL